MEQTWTPVSSSAVLGVTQGPGSGELRGVELIFEERLTDLVRVDLGPKAST